METAVSNLAVYTDELGQRVLEAVGAWQHVFTSPHDPKILEMVTMRSYEAEAVGAVVCNALQSHCAYVGDEESFQSFCDLVSCCCTVRPDVALASAALPDILSTYVHVPIVEAAAGQRGAPSDKALVASLCRMVGGVVSAALTPQQLLLCAVFGEQGWRGEVGSVLNTLLLAVKGGLPSWALDDIMAAFRTIIETLSAGVTAELMYVAMCQPSFARSDVSDKAKEIFLEDVQRLGGMGDWKRLKNAVKKFCGGKKKNTAGTPANARVRTRSVPLL